MKPPKVSAIDYLTAFTDPEQAHSEQQTRRQANHQERMRLLAQFQECWATNLGTVCEVPSDEQIFKWFKIGKWDFLLLSASIEDLRCRSKYGMDRTDPYGHCLRHFTSALVRRLRGKYGPPPQKRAA